MAAVLTAAHCVVDTGDGRVRSIQIYTAVYGNLETKGSMTRTRVEAEDVEYLPQFYDGGEIDWDYDVALLAFNILESPSWDADNPAWPAIRRKHPLTHSLPAFAAHVSCAMTHNPHVMGWIPVWHATLHGRGTQCLVQGLHQDQTQRSPHDPQPGVNYLNVV